MNYLTNNHVKATRKAHSCEWCGQRIEKGDPAEVVSGFYDNRATRYWLHPECEPALGEWIHHTREPEFMPFEGVRGKPYRYDEVPA